MGFHNFLQNRQYGYKNSQELRQRINNVIEQNSTQPQRHSPTYSQLPLAPTSPQSPLAPPVSQSPTLLSSPPSPPSEEEHADPATSMCEGYHEVEWCYEEDWVESLKEWFSTTPFYIASALASTDNGQYFAMSGQDDCIFKADYVKVLRNDDGASNRMVLIDENKQLRRLVTDRKSPEDGIWFAGQKYVLMNQGTMEDDDEHVYFWALAVCSKRFVYICSTGLTVVCGFFSSEAHTSRGVCLDYTQIYARHLKKL